MNTTDREDLVTAAFLALLWACVAALAVFLITAAFTDHHVRRYYIGLPTSSESGLTCVYAELPWETDDKVYCSVDSAKTLYFASQANALISGRASQ